MSKVLSYNENEVNVLFSKDFTTTSSNGKIYPSNRILIEEIDYSGEFENNGEKKPYSGTKIKITNVKLTLEDGETVKKKKVINGRVVDDATICKMKVEEFNEIFELKEKINSFNKKPLRTVEKQKEEEISIEDIPF